MSEMFNVRSIYQIIKHFLIKITKNRYLFSCRLVSLTNLHTKKTCQVKPTGAPSEDQWTWLPSSNSMPNATFLRPHDLGWSARDGVDHGWVVYSFCFWLNTNMVRYNIIIIVHLNVQALACDLQRCLFYSFTWCSVIHGLVDIWCFGLCKLILTLDWNITWFIDWFLTHRFEYQSLKQKTTCMMKGYTFWWHHTMAPCDSGYDFYSPQTILSIRRYKKHL